MPTRITKSKYRLESSHKKRRRNCKRMLKFSKCSKRMKMTSKSLRREVSSMP